MVAARIAAAERAETCEHVWEPVSDRDEWCSAGCGQLRPRGLHLLDEAERALAEARWAIDRLGGDWRAAEQVRERVRVEVQRLGPTALKLMSVDELARRIGTSRQTIYNWLG
jgi:hypothetical protein